jgi:hypothetical protein
MNRRNYEQSDDGTEQIFEKYFQQSFQEPQRHWNAPISQEVSAKRWPCSLKVTYNTFLQSGYLILRLQKLPKVVLGKRKLNIP